MNLIEILDQLSQYYGINFKEKYSFWTIIAFTFCWIDYLYAWILTIFSFNRNDEDCYFLEIGCLLFGKENSLHGNIMYNCYRSISFILFNIWYFNDHHWLVEANEQYLLLNLSSIKLSSNSITSWIKRSLIFVYIIMIFYNLVTDIMIEQYLFRNYFETIILHLISSYLVYCSSYFFLKSYLINNICVELFSNYNNCLKVCLQRKFVQPELIQTFWTLFLMIQFVKKYLKLFYIVLVGCIFALNLEIVYFVFYLNLPPIKHYLLSSVLVTFILYIIYFSSISGKIDIEAKNLIAIIYEYVNIFNFSLKINDQFEENLKVRLANLF